MNSEDTPYDTESMPSYPPPERKPKQKLSLKTAMALATRTPGHETLMPLVQKSDKDLASNGNTDTQKKMEAYLLDLQADIINREELLEQREKQIKARENDLNKRELLQTQSIEPHVHTAELSTLSEEKKAAMESPEEVSEKSKTDPFKETLEMLREREAYIEQCENSLVEKLTQLTQREAEIEQREEQLAFELKQLQ